MADIENVGAKTRFPLIEEFADGQFLGGSAVFQSGDYTQRYGFEPQRRNNGILFAPIPEIKSTVTFAGSLPGMMTLALRSVEMPKDEVEVIELGYFNQRRSFAGQHRTDEITVTFIDYVDTPILQVLESWFASVYNPVIGAVNWAAGNPESPVRPFFGGYKQDVYLMTYSPNIDWVYTKVFRLEGAFPTRLDRGELDYGDDEPMEITMTLRYDEVYFILHGLIPELATIYASPSAAGTFLDKQVLSSKLDVP